MMRNGEGMYGYRYVGKNGDGERVCGFSDVFEDYPNRNEYLKKGLERFVREEGRSRIASLERVDLFLMRRMGSLTEDDFMSREWFDVVGENEE